MGRTPIVVLELYSEGVVAAVSLVLVTIILLVLAIVVFRVLINQLGRNWPRVQRVHRRDPPPTLWRNRTGRPQRRGEQRHNRTVQ